MMLLTAIACGQGWVSYPGGRSELETAMWIKGTIDGTDTVILLLSNSKLGCELSTTDDEDDPALVEAALLDVATALFREDARNLVLWLKRTGGDALGTYDVAGTAEAQARWSEGLYMGVNEAELDYDGGLLRSYAPVDYDVREAGSGEVELTRLDDDAAEGTFSFDDIEVAGRFDAAHCAESIELFEYLGLLEYGPTDLFGAFEDTDTDDLLD